MEPGSRKCPVVISIVALAGALLGVPSAAQPVGASEYRLKAVFLRLHINLVVATPAQLKLGSKLLRPSLQIVRSASN
jgi:hypothetical protein